MQGDLASAPISEKCDHGSGESTVTQGERIYHNNTDRSCYRHCCCRSAQSRPAQSTGP